MNIEPQTSKPSYEQLEKLLEQTTQQLRVALDRIAILEEEVRGLKTQLKLNSSNSSRPPASDPPWTPKSERIKTGTKPGGQKGHPGSSLKMVALPDQTIVHPVKDICECGLNLKVANLLNLEKRQVFDLPVIKILVVEHQVEVKQCQCGRIHRGVFPDGVSQATQYGSHVKGISTYLMLHQLIPFERTKQFFQDVLQLEISQGSLQNFQIEAFKKLEVVESKIKAQLMVSNVNHFDETGYAKNLKLCWMHVVSNKKLTYYQTHPKRGREAMNALGILPHFTGVAVHDCFESYFSYGVQHSLCNAHLLRELRRVEEQNKQTWAGSMRGLLCEIKVLVDSSQTGVLNVVEQHNFEVLFDGLLVEAQALNLKQERKLETGKRGRVGQSFAFNLVARMVKYRNEILRFMREKDVPFDNNLAERDLRMFKVQQKVSGCFRGDGDVWAARIRGYLSSIRKQGLNALEAMVSVFRGQPLLPPSLCNAG